MTDIWFKYNVRKSDWYKKDVEKHFQPFIDYFKDCHGETLTTKHLFDYQSHLEKQISKRSRKPYTTTYISIILSTIRSVWNFNRKFYPKLSDIYFEFKIPKRAEKKDWLNMDQLKKLIDVAKNNQLYQGFIELLISTGLRIGELHKLKWENVHDTHLVLEFTKRGKDDVIKMREDIKEVIEKIRHNQQIHKRYVFSSNKGKHYSYDTGNKIVKRYLKLAGFPNHTPHSLRHSYATNLILMNYDIYYIKELMRHDHVSTTEKYIQFTGMDVESRNEIRFIQRDGEIRWLDHLERTDV